MSEHGSEWLTLQVTCPLTCRRSRGSPPASRLPLAKLDFNGLESRDIACDGEVIILGCGHSSFSHYNFISCGFVGSRSC